MAGVQLVVDCVDPSRLVAFWAAALDYEPAPPPAGHRSWRDFYVDGGVPEGELPEGDACDRVIDPAGVGPALWFQAVPEVKTIKNRLHLDVQVGGGRDVPVGRRRQRVDARERVLQAARELGYTPHHGAQSLRRKASQHLGVTFSPAHASEPEIAEAVYAAAGERGYQVMLSAQSPVRDQRATVEELLSYRCAAVLQLGAELSHRQLVALAQRAGVPTVLVGPGSSNRAYDVVRSDGAAGLAAVTDHLLELGHHRLAYVHCPQLPSAAERLRGFTEAAGRANADTAVVEVRGLGYTEEAGSEAARRLLAGPDLPTALIAGNDQQAVGALWVLLRTGVDVPGQMSVTGFDDTRYARLSAVDLTTASQDTEALGRAAVEAAIRRIEQPDLAPALTVVQPRLVVRSSTAPPPGDR